MVKFKKLYAEELEREHLSVLREIGRQIGVKSPASQKKEELVENILKIQNGEEKPSDTAKRGAPAKIKIDISKFLLKEEDVYYTDDSDSVSYVTFEDCCQEFEIKGTLDLHPSGYGFLRTDWYDPTKKDIYVSAPIIKKYRLCKGDEINCMAKEVKDGSSAALQSILTVNGATLADYQERIPFDNLTPCYPRERLTLEREKPLEDDVAIRVVDLFAPVGKGQRGLIVAPPKTGKTTLLKTIAQAIVRNHKDVKIMILLIDERPEEVTDLKRSVQADVIASTFDEGSENHVRTAESVLTRAKRYVEAGRDVVILMDSITRLARAYNNVVDSSGKTLSGGLDPTALIGPKRFFGSARNVDMGGSLTILATALVDTGSRMDDVIYEEFKGTGNMEIHLSRELSEKRVFPAIDVYKSGTRKEELLLSKEELSATYKIRAMLSSRHDATETVFEMIKKSKDNADLVSKIDTWIKLYNK